MERSIKFILKALFQLCLLTSLISAKGLFAEENALVIRGQTASFDDVVKGMVDDLDGELTIKELVVSKDLSVKDIETEFKKSKPKLVVLVGNKAVNLYASFQENNKDMDFPPAIAMAALFIDKFVSKLKNAKAIRYEIPAVTSLVAMRNILGTPVKKVGVIYREWMDDLIEENARYCKAEGIELVPIKLANKESNVESAIKKALDKFDDSVDAIWILNDNELLTASALGNAWIPLRGKSKVPGIVGIKMFMTKFQLGSFAIVPDDYGLGVQAAGIIFELKDNDWQFENDDVVQPVSVKKFINVSTLESKGVKYQQAMLNQVDEVVK